MFRKLLLAGVLGVGLLAPVAGAHEYHRDYHPYHHHERRYEHAYAVFYSDPCHPGWVCVGTFDGYRDAQRFAELYRCKGFAVSIR